MRDAAQVDAFRPDTGPVCEAFEVCDGRDTDCDGMVDNGADVPCGTAGTCSAGTRFCVDGVLGDCTPEVAPVDEVCEGSVDEDCDGTVDEACECSSPGATRDCGSDVGRCEFGSQVCQVSGEWSACTGGTVARDERCNGRDDDCDGSIDGMTRSCSTDVGVCSVGVETCTDGAFVGCTGTLAGTEVCDLAGLDEDCDGDTTAACECVVGATSPRVCTTPLGCAGSETCEAPGVYGACVAASVAETCDGTDEDCDGTIDESDADCQTETGCDVVYFGGHTYLLCEGLGWSEARAFCMGVGPGYDLAVIETSAEQAFLDDETDDLPSSESEWWIGLRDVTGGEKDYRWVVTEELPTPYSNWGSSEPSHNDQCVFLDNGANNGDWDSKGCGGGRGFICEATTTP